jgi:hypothetical protein
MTPGNREIGAQIEKNWRRVLDNIDLIGVIHDRIAAHPLRLRRNRKLLGKAAILKDDNTRLLAENEQILWDEL